MRDVVHAAYRHYIPRIGKPPGPMLDDYAQRIADGQAWVLEDGGHIVGILVLERDRTGLLLDNIAVLPDVPGQGPRPRADRIRRSRGAPARLPAKSISTRMR